MKIKKFCWYKMKCFSVLPGLIITPKYNGVCIALKFWNRHIGVWLMFESQINSKDSFDGSVNPLTTLKEEAD